MVCIKTIGFAISVPDRGAADAINRGRALSREDIVAWLYADDTYPPGATTIPAFSPNSSASIRNRCAT
jgi:hypothetical protein